MFSIEYKDSESHFVSVPYDDNYVKLTTCPDEVDYVNASRIVFSGVAQKFLAACAPKPASYRHFWQMVIQEKVSFFFDR